MQESFVRGVANRLLQIFARLAPGATTVRIWAHRARGVRVGAGVWIGYDAIIETSRPDLVVIGDGVSLGMRSMIIAHFHGAEGVRVEKDAFIGPGAIVLPNVVIGRGSVVTAGSVVTRSVPPETVVQGNPATPISHCGKALTLSTTLKEFVKHIKPLPSPNGSPKTTAGKIPDIGVNGA
jgi:serine acetyltransferase